MMHTLFWVTYFMDYFTNVFEKTIFFKFTHFTEKLSLFSDINIRYPTFLHGSWHRTSIKSWSYGNVHQTFRTQVTCNKGQSFQRYHEFKVKLILKAKKMFKIINLIKKQSRQNLTKYWREDNPWYYLPTKTWHDITWNTLLILRVTIISEYWE